MNDEKIKIKSENGQVIDVVLTSRRGATAARRF